MAGTLLVCPPPRCTASSNRRQGQFAQQGGAGTVAERPIQQRIDGNRNTFGIGDVVVTGGNLLGAAGEFSAGQSLEHQRGHEAVSKQGEFFSFGVHDRTILRTRALARCKCCVWAVRRMGKPAGARRDARREPESEASLTGECATRKTGSGAPWSSQRLGTFARLW